MPLPPAALPDATVPAASADLIDTLLPQTQCRQCGFSGCRPYAEAIAGGSAAINRCPPGGDELITEIAAVLGVTPLTLDTTLGQATPPAVACIDESACIGCALCLDVCPVDAIVGARKWMHTVITWECTGCGLCVPPCPVDCITLVPTGAALNRAAQRAESARLRQRYQAHLRRQQRKTTERLEQRSRSAETRKRDTVARAMARARKRLTPR